MDDQALYETLTRIESCSARMEAKLDGALARLNDHSRRLHGLERFRWIVVGGGAALGFIIAARENLAGLFKALGK